MKRCQYNCTVRDILQDLEFDVDDAREIARDKTQFHDILSKCAYENYDDSFQPITACVNLLHIMFQFICDYQPSIPAVYQLMRIWQETLLCEKNQPLDQIFSTFAKNYKVQLSTIIQQQVYKFLNHIQFNNNLIRAVIDYNVPIADMILEPIRKPTFSYIPQNKATLQSEIEEKQLKQNDEQELKVLKAKEMVNLEQKLIQIEDTFSIRMAAEIKKRKDHLHQLKLRQEQEHEVMQTEDQFAQQLSEIYREQLIERQEENECISAVQKVTVKHKESVNTALVQQLQPQKKK